MSIVLETATGHSANCSTDSSESQIIVNSSSSSSGSSSVDNIPSTANCLESALIRPFPPAASTPPPPPPVPESSSPTSEEQGEPPPPAPRHRLDSENSSSMTQDDDLLDNDNVVDVKPSFFNKQFPGMGGLSIPPHHGLSAAFHGYHAAAHTNVNSGAAAKTPFLLPAEIYKSLFASAVLQKQQQQQQQQQQHQHHHPQQPGGNLCAAGGAGIGGDKGHGGPPPPTPFPRNLLFSCSSEKLTQSGSDNEADERSNHKAAAFVWSNDGTVTSAIPHHNNNNTTTNNNNSTNNNQSSAAGTPVPGASPVTTISSPPGLGPNSGMPVGGVQGQNPTQGLVHWMSAVMAEHMTGNTHHDPTVGMHYMWNGGVDQCGQHSKDIDYSGWPAPRNHMSMKQGYEAKMNDHHNNLQKGHLLDDGRLDHHPGAQGGQMAIYGAAGALRSSSSSSSSPGGGHGHPGAAAAAALLVVPQPINATKISAGLTNGTGTGRKYQCKMCPQIFSSKADLQLHTQIHMREAKPYKCSQCAKAFANSSYLSQHTRIHLGIKPYRCEICQRKFTQLSHLQQHIRTHTGDKPYKCRHPGCQKAFSQLSNLQSHSRCHQTDKPYKCNSCYKCFSDEPSLLEHIPKHKESKHLKTHICQYCGKSYTQETYLTKHMQKHAERTDKRPPITAAGLGINLNRNLGLNTALPPVPGEHPYWPKVSPDSAASLTEVMHQQQQQQHQQQQQQQQSHHDFPPINPQHQPNNGHSDLQAHHRMLDSHRDDVASTPSGPYDAASITKTTTNSAFTPINSMTPHLNSLGHHPMAQRPYLYDAISFQNKNVNQNTANSFPNQLISLHQIRNYAHQPAGLMAGEHLLGVSVGAGKDKG